MRYLLLISTLTTSLLFSAASWAEWTEVDESVHGDKFYVDLDSIKKVKGLVYYWNLEDLLEPTSKGFMSFKAYSKVDCETMREMLLSLLSYKLPMGEGDAETFTPSAEWDSAPPGSAQEVRMKAVCNR